MSNEKKRLVSKARKFRQEGKTQQAITTYEKVLKLDTKDVLIVNILANLYVELKDTDKAMKFYLRAASLLTKDGFHSRALACYKRILEFSPNNREIWESMADLYRKLGLFAEAEKLSAKLNPPPAKFATQKRQHRKQLKDGLGFKHQFKKSRNKNHRKALIALKEV